VGAACRPWYDLLADDDRERLRWASQSIPMANRRHGARWLRRARARSKALTGGELHVEQQLSRDGGRRVELKTVASDRRIPMSRELTAALRRWKLRTLHTRDEDFVFATGTDTAIGQRNTHRMITTLAESAGINEVKPRSAPEDWAPSNPARMFTASGTSSSRR
jgi:hypothetical protein